MTCSGYAGFAGQWGDNARLAWDAIHLRPTRGIPTWILHVMQWSHIETIAGRPPGSYRQDPVGVYLDFQLNAGVCFNDQWIPENPLTMGDQGYRPDAQRRATTGAEQIVLDGVTIDSPEAVADHMERFVFPKLQATRAKLQARADARVGELIEQEVLGQQRLGLNLLRGPQNGFYSFPRFFYNRYGYTNYFMAYALYPELIEKSFALQADLAEVVNRIGARAIVEGQLPPILRLDHDMADSRGTLVDVKSLDRIWFPHFARCIQPHLDAGVRLIWHCDGNLMAMIPRLIEAGVRGFQGFQYEDGMDYPAICRMTDRDGGPLLIIGGVSVTTTLPHGTPDDVRQELRWLVEHGPRAGLMLGCTSSIAPGVPIENLRALLEGMAHYRAFGRG